MKDWGQVAGDGRAAVGAGRAAGIRIWTVRSMGRDQQVLPTWDPQGGAWDGRPRDCVFSASRTQPT